MNNLANMHYNGQGGLPKNIDAALALYKSSAEGGDVIGMVATGNINYYTIGDLNEALTWYRKAAERGDAYATGMVGFVYYKGNNNFNKDIAQAKYWFERGAAKEDAESINAIGLMYLQGVHVNQCYSEAFNWFMKGINAGSFRSLGNLADLYEAGNGVKKDRKKAAELRASMELWKEYNLQSNWKSATGMNSIA